MKKIFTLVLALFAMVAVNAQVLFSENFDNGTMPTGWTTVDADGDTHTWEPSGNPASYFDPSVDLSGTGHNGSNGFILSGSYSNSLGTALTPDNWLITPAINLTANANLTFWVCAQDANYAAEHYGVYISTTGTATSNFTLLMEETIDENGGSRQGAWKQKTVNLSNYTGQTVYIAFRHFNCTDEFLLDLDDVEIFAQPTDPTIIAQPTTVNFGSTILGTTKTQTVNVVTYNLTAGVTATTTAPFAVSADGTTFGTTATVASTGGTLYVQYTPTAVGTDNDSVTLASSGATDVTIAVSGSGMECNATVPYSYSFTDETANQCWEVINANNDDYTFEFTPEEGYASIRWNSSLDADDWLISPYFALTGSELGSFDYRGGSSSYIEKFQVFAIGADTVTLTPVIQTVGSDFQTQYLDLSSLTGNYRIAIHCISDADQLRLYIANFNINVAGVASLTVDPEDIDFSTIPMNSTSVVEEVEITAISITNPITVSVAAPFEISIDSTSFGATATIPASTAIVSIYTAYVRFAPTAVGNFTQNMTITDGTLTATVALTGAAADCSNGISTFPFVYDFNTGIYPPICWGYNNAENYWQATVEEGVDYAMGVSGIDMLVTPEITSTSDLALMFDYRTYLGDNMDDGESTSFRVGYSTTNDNVSSFTWLPTVDVTSYPEETLFFTYAATIPANAKYVAIDFLSIGSYFGGWYEDAIYLDNFRLLNDAYMSVTPEIMEFGSAIIGNTSLPKTATVTTALLSNPVTVTATANFEVSTNGTSYAATATVPATGGNLYVRYNPTAAGYHNGTVTLTSGSLTKNITVSGSAVDCSAPQTLPFTENFESDLSACWVILDEDGDGYSWESSFAPVSYYSSSVDLSGSGNNGSDGFYLSGSYSNVLGGALAPDNWLITPALVIPSNGAKLKWYVSAIDENYADEHYDVLLSTSLNPSNFTSVFSETIETAEWEERTVNINGNWAGQTVYIAFRNYNTEDIFLMKIDDISVTPGTGVENHELNAVIFPNPANNVLNINANSNINRVEVYNMMGQLVGAYNANDVNTQINTTSFANGVYTVKIETENGTSTQKFTVAR